MNLEDLPRTKNDEYGIIDATFKAAESFGFNYSEEVLMITQEEWEKIKNGKCLAVGVNGHEYSLFLVVDKS